MYKLFNFFIINVRCQWELYPRHGCRARPWVEKQTKNHSYSNACYQTEKLSLDASTLVLQFFKEHEVSQAWLTSTLQTESILACREYAWSIFSCREYAWSMSWATFWQLYVVVDFFLKTVWISPIKDVLITLCDGNILQFWQENCIYLKSLKLNVLQN